MKKLPIVLFLVLFNLPAIGQELKFEKTALSDSAMLAINIKNLAKDYLKKKQIEGLTIDPNDLYKIEILTGHYQTSIENMEALRGDVENKNEHRPYIQYELFAKAKLKQLESGKTFNEVYKMIFRDYLMSCSDEKAYSTNIVFTTYDAVAQFTNKIGRAHV